MLQKILKKLDEFERTRRPILAATPTNLLVSTDTYGNL